MYALLPIVLWQYGIVHVQHSHDPKHASLIIIRGRCCPTCCAFRHTSRVVVLQLLLEPIHAASSEMPPFLPSTATTAHAFECSDPNLRSLEDSTLEPLQVKLHCAQCCRVLPSAAVRSDSL
jgi:hypothetical protein